MNIFPRHPGGTVRRRVGLFFKWYPSPIALHYHYITLLYTCSCYLKKIFVNDKYLICIHIFFNIAFNVFVSYMYFLS